MGVNESKNAEGETQDGVLPEREATTGEKQEIQKKRAGKSRGGAGRWDRTC